MKAYQNCGFGKEMLLALIDLMFHQLNGHKFLCSCFRENNASALAKSFGFVYTHSKTASVSATVMNTTVIATN